MELFTVSYKDVIGGYEPNGDVYGLAAYALAEPRKTAFLTNPNLKDTSKVMLKLMCDEGKIIGRSMMFPSRFKAGNEVIETMGGSALEVALDYRDGEAGGALMAYNIRHKENNAIISSGFSDVAAKCHHALRAYMLCFTQMSWIKDFRQAFLKAGLNKRISASLGVIVNLVVWPFQRYVFHKAAKIMSNYTVEEVKIVPEWVDPIVLNDGHQFMEVHDHRWLQWTLDNMFHSHKSNINRFYTVSSNGENLGFFMIKERARKIKKGSSSEMVVGTICEWGTKDPAKLSEYDLQLMALKAFSKSVDVIFMATTDIEVEKKMKRLLFLKRGEAKIAFYDLQKEYKEAKDIKLWRARIGYGDTILN